MNKVHFLLYFLLLLGFTVAEADLRIVGVSRMPDQDFYLGGDSVKFNITVYNYGDIPGDGNILINATGNSPELDCPFLTVEPGFTSTAICPFEVVIRNTTNLIQIKLSSGGNLVSTKNLTLFSTNEFQKKTKVPDSNPIVIILTVLIALTIMNFANNKPKQKRGQTSGEYIALVAGGAMFVLIVIVAVNSFFNAPAKQAVITQGSLVQQQFGSLSNAFEGKNPITLRRPLTYDNLATNPSAIAFQNNVCLLNATLFTDESGEMTAVSTLDDLENVEIGTLESFQYQFARNGVWYYNVLVCTCDNVCGWHFSDVDGNPTNQQIEIVAQDDIRYQNAYRLFLSRGDAPGARAQRNQNAILNGTLATSWSCNLGQPILDASTRVTGTNLQNLTLTCALNGRTLSSFREINSPGTPAFQILDENAEGQSSCILKTCNSTECILSDPNQANICTPQVEGVNALTIGQNGDGILDFGLCNRDDPARCDTWTGTAHFNLNADMVQYTAVLMLYSFNTVMRPNGEFVTEVNEISERNLGQIWPGQQNKEVTVHSRYSQWKIKICNANNQCTYSQSGQVQQQVLAVV